MAVQCRPYVKLSPKVNSPWSVSALCKAYNWPSGLAGGGVIAIVELGGGYRPDDMIAYFDSIHQPMPSITNISVDGTQNSPGQSDADMEVALDIQVAAAAYYVAAGVPAVVRVYWSNQNIEAAVKAAAADGCDVCSISWGADEQAWGPEAALMEQAALAAANAGMIVFAASGDSGSADGGPGLNVDVPASCPHVVGCGGTTKTATKETAWSMGGGGYSKVFPVESWQIGAPTGPGRLVPDLAAAADPSTGYQIVVGGQTIAVGGTSAVAPLYAGLFAALGKKLGWVTPNLWANPDSFVDIIYGSNGAYKAGPGPDPCTGVGVPNGAALATLYAASGVPTPSPVPVPPPTPVPPVPPTPPAPPPPTPTPVPPPPSPSPPPGHKKHTKQEVIDALTDLVNESTLPG